MDEYIKREALIAEFKRLKLGENSFIERVFADGVYAIIEQFPAADVVPTQQERTYKDLLDALFEDVRSLDTTLADACCMCSKGECDDCNLRTFEDELSAILARAAERKKRLAD